MVAMYCCVQNHGIVCKNRNGYIVLSCIVSCCACFVNRKIAQYCAFGRTDSTFWPHHNQNRGNVVFCRMAARRLQAFERLRLRRRCWGRRRHQRDVHDHSSGLGRKSSRKQSNKRRGWRRFRRSDDECNNFLKNNSNTDRESCSWDRVYGGRSGESIARKLWRDKLCVIYMLYGAYHTNIIVLLVFWQDGSQIMEMISCVVLCRVYY